MTNESQIECRNTLKSLTDSNTYVLDTFDLFSSTLKDSKITALDKEAIYKAVEYGAECHKQQKRKDRLKTPYIIHPIGVANYIIEIGKCYDRDVIIAALLHDVVEDTEATLEDVEKNFGKAVMEYVSEVTDDKSLPKEERKLLQLVNAPHKSEGAAHIKLADKIYNTRDLLFEPIPDWSPERVKEYFSWSKSVVERLPDVNPPLKELFMSINESFNTGRQYMSIR